MVDECIAFARSKGYKILALRSDDVFAAARGISLATGFVLVKEERHVAFGKALVGQNWDLKL